MAKQRQQPGCSLDPWPYEGSLRRADGVAPYNHYLWPLDADSFWAGRELGHNRFSCRWHFSAVALADGRWLSDGFVRVDEAQMRFFSTRQAALRHSAAAMLRTAMHARRRPERWCWGNDYLSPDKFVALVNWTNEKLSLPAMRLTARPEPPEPQWADLPLFAERSA